MCGIAGFSLSPEEQVTNPNRIARHLLLDIEHRGRDATGFAFLDSTGKFQIHKAPMAATPFIKARRLCVPRKTRTLIAHTRFATQGSPSINDNNHPIRSGSVVGVHNGWVNNDMTIFKDLESYLGFNPRTADVDSEAIFAMLGFLPEWEVTDLLEQLNGTAALAWMDLDDKDEDTLHLARVQSSPLVLGFTEAGSLLFASEKEGIQAACYATGMKLAKLYEELEEGQYLKVVAGEVVDVKTFQPDYGYYTKSAKTYSRSGSDATPWEERQTTSNTYRTLGRVYDYDLDSWVEETWDDEDARYDQWMKENASATAANVDDAIADLAELKQTSASDRDDGAELIMKAPYVSTAYLEHPDLAIPRLSDKRYEDVIGTDRRDAIDRWLRRFHGKDETVVNLKAFVQRGQLVKTTVMGQEAYAHVYTLPTSFPHGMYTLRAYVKHAVRTNGYEAVYVSRGYWEFEVLDDRVEDMEEKSAGANRGQLALVTTTDD